MRNLIIALVAIVLILVIAAVIIYFAAPDLFEEIAGAILPDRGEQTSPDDGTTPDDGGSGTPPTVLAPGDGELQVHFMDVGQGDSILILFPDGKDMLTHCDGDHVYFMDEVLEKYDVDTVFMPNVLAEPSGTQSSDRLQAEIDALDQNKVGMFTDEDTVDSNAYAEFFIAALSEPECEIVLNVDPDEDTNSIVITDGTKLSDGTYDGATYMLTFYCPTEEYYATADLSSAEEKNAISPIGILEYNDVRIVLTGDSNEINEPTFVDRIGGSLDCDVLKVGHHGSETSSTEEFLDAINCEYAVISCNADGNTFSHPRQVTLDRLIADDMTIYRTDNNGNIVLSVDENGEMTFTTEREVDQAVNRVGADAAAAN